MRRLLLACAALLPALAAEDDRPVVAKRLDDPDWVVRALAAKSVGDRKHDISIHWLRERLPKESNEYVQAFILRALQAFPLDDLSRVGGKALVPASLKPLKAKSPFVRAQAEATLQLLTGQKGQDWEAWWKAQEPTFAFTLPKEAPGRGLVEAKTPQATSFEETVYDARRRGLETVFVLDQTGSMQPTIDAAKAQVLDLCEYLHLLVPKYKVGLVTFDDGVQVRFPLTQDYASLKARLDRVKAVGGGDEPEGVDKAVSAALEDRIGWSKGARKVLIVIGDAPAHAADVPAMLEQVELAADKGWTLNAIDVGKDRRGQFPALAKAGKGVAVSAGGPELVQQMLILSLGDEHRKALEGFVDVIRKVRERPTPPKP